jgi:hypothetical protein
MTGCLVESNQSWGVAGIYYAFEVEGSSVVGNGGSGIELDKYEDSRIRGNRIAGNGEAGIRFSFALQPGTVTGNIIQSNRVGLLAVFPGQSLSDTGISSNIISENLEYEISNLSSGVIIADGNYWGEPTTTELNGAVANLTKIHDSHDAPASAGQVLIRSWNDSPVGGGPVVIVQGLEDQTVNAGAEVGWTVVVEGEGGMVYQWFKDGVAIGNNGDTLQLGQVAMEDAGVYSVVVGNSFVSASSSARLTVAGENAPPPPVLDLASFAGLTIYGTPGQSYQVQYGTDADTPVWVPLTNITLSTTHYFFVDRESAGPGKRFYRVVELPDSSP